MMILAALLALGVQASSQETRIAVADLRGLTPEEVGGRMNATPGVGPGDAVRIVDAGRTVDLYPMRRFWRRPAAEDEGCLTGLEAAAAEGDTMEQRTELVRRGGGLIAFENGRLTAVYPDQPPPPVPARPTGRPVTARDLREQMRAPRPASPLARAPGRLPLSDGLDVLSRFEPANEGAVLVTLCRTLPARGGQRSDPGMDIIWGLVGLTVLPLVPFQTAEDARAEREGGALLASVNAGDDLGMPPEAWAGGARGVRVYRDTIDADFAVIAVKLGSGHDTVAKVGLLGVRGTRVIWRVERDAADQTGIRSLICRDENNRSTNARRGCSTTGFLIP